MGLFLLMFLSLKNNNVIDVALRVAARKAAALPFFQFVTTRVMAVGTPAQASQEITSGAVLIPRRLVALPCCHQVGDRPLHQLVSPVIAAASCGRAGHDGWGLPVCSGHPFPAASQLQHLVSFRGIGRERERMEEAKHMQDCL